MRSIFFCLWIVAGCGSEALPEGGNATPAASTEQAIQGGVEDPGDPAVGLVWIKGGGFCSGTLIAPDVVLTAGHCVADPISSFYTGVGKGATEVGRLPVAGFVSHKVIAQVAHPSYEGVDECPNPTFDVGLLKLAKPIAGVTPLVLAKKPARTGATCTGVGYGVHDDGSGEQVIEQRRSATEKVMGVASTSVHVKKESGIVDHGDSGGPLLCSHQIVGVTSCGNQESPDQTEAYYGRVDSIGQWVDATIASWQ